ncbi:hypothetical protein [Streptomyces sp. NBC_01304]|uniref:hypothetical protein n=1 Tax=Streptomyces sp. NBC_01304 TaxID=2903818 RepID=UPI002E11546E|nr:hypothetical protein OG430_06970 [Streptomyces sp. NBC_01304]
MKNVSRRTLLGYSGTAAAGAVLTGAGSATATEKEAAAPDAATAQAAGAAQEPVEWGPGAEFNGSTSIGDIDAYMEVKFSIRVEQAPAANNITALEVANALNELAAARGWPRIQFNGTISAPLN